MGLFKKRTTAPAAPSPQDAIAKVDAQISLNAQKAEQIQKKIADLRAQVKAAMAKNNRPMAANLLRQAKMYEQQLATIEQMNTNLQQQSLQLQMAHMQAMNVQTIQTTVQAQRQLQAQANVTPDTVADLQDDLADLQATQQEINSILTQPIDGMEMDGLDDELAQMEADLAAEQLDEVSAVPQRALPQAQVAAPAAAQIDEDAELAALMM